MVVASSVRASDKRRIGDNSKIIFFYVSMKTCCDPSLELSRQEGSNEESQNMVLYKNIDNYAKIIFVTPSHL